MFDWDSFDQDVDSVVVMNRIEYLTKVCDFITLISNNGDEVKNISILLNILGSFKTSKISSTSL